MDSQCDECKRWFYTDKLGPRYDVMRFIYTRRYHRASPELRTVCFNCLQPDDNVYELQKNPKETA